MIELCLREIDVVNYGMVEYQPTIRKFIKNKDFLMFSRHKQIRSQTEPSQIRYIPY